MNRSLPNVLFGGISAPVSSEAHKIEGTITKTTVDDTADALANAENVILVRLVTGRKVICSSHCSVQVVGYGMAVAKAQYAISEITAMLRAKGINVRVSSADDVT